MLVIIDEMDQLELEASGFPRERAAVVPYRR
jgi:hypothetical protein